MILLKVRAKQISLPHKHYTADNLAWQGARQTLDVSETAVGISFSQIKKVF